MRLKGGRKRLMIYLVVLTNTHECNRRTERIAVLMLWCKKLTLHFTRYKLLLPRFTTDCRKFF